MSTFSKSTFDAAAYLAFRPSYPRWVNDKVLVYHFGGKPGAPSAGRADLAVDLGCGPGISTLALLPHFDKVIGIDPSSKMVNAAVHPDTPNLPAALKPNAQEGAQGRLGKLEYKQGFSEDLAYLADESVDLITSGQAAHWFDYSRFWPELTRILKPGGSVCLYGYPDFFLPDFPSTRALLNKFAVPRGQGSPTLEGADAVKVDSIGDYWEQPGRSIINQGLSPVPFPTTYPAIASHWDAASAFKRTFSTQGLQKNQIWSSWPELATTPLKNASSLPDAVQTEFSTDNVTLDKHLTWDQLASYLRTWSATHTYLDQHPDDKQQHGGKDVVDRFLAQLKEEITKANKGKPVDDLHLRWPLCFVMIKKKGGSS